MNPTPIIPDEEDVRKAIQSSRILANIIKQESDADLKTSDLPEPALNMLMVILDQMAKGNAITLMPHKDEITTQEAADILNVSRPFFITLLESNKIPYRKVGNRRKILLNDVTNYKKLMYNARLDTLVDILTHLKEGDSL